MNKPQIEKLYKEICVSWDKNLKKHGVKLPNLKKGDSYIINALVLTYLYANMKRKVSKSEITSFLGSMGINSNDVQQPRHLAQQNGWYILSGTRKDTECTQYGVNAGEYMLLSIKEPYPSYKAIKRTQTLGANSWEDLKRKYDYRCATCGSKEGQPNFLYPATVTTLQQGHKDPSKALGLENTIPQCPFCNRASRDYFVFDNKGRVEKIHDPLFVLRSDKDIQLIMLNLLIDKHWNKAKEIIDQESSLGN